MLRGAHVYSGTESCASPGSWVTDIAVFYLRFFFSLWVDDDSSKVRTLSDPSNSSQSTVIWFPRALPIINL